MALHIHHGSHLVPLVDSLAGILAHPLADPFTAEVIAVPTAGIRDWLQQHLALRLGTGDQLLDFRAGVSANIDMLFPSAFTAAVLGQDRGSTSPWDLDRLTWTVLAVLDSGEVEVPGWRSRNHGTYATARRIADLFDGYATNRPQLIQQWALGRDGDGTLDEREAIVPLSADHRWQAALWRAVRARIREPNPAEQLPDLLEDLRSGRTEPTLPERVAVFGLSAVSTAQLTVVRALGEVRDVHVHLVHPSPTAWQNVRQHLAGRLVLRSACDASAAVRHPLLRSWARPAMEAAALVGGLEPAVRITRHEPARDRRADSLLGRIQRGLSLDDIDVDIDIDLAAPGGAADNLVDRSVQVHGCHGTVRQLEVLRDALGHLFAADPTLTPRDVVILCPDLTRFAALIPSVFQRSTLPLPVRVTDLSLGSDNPVASALVDVLALLAGRCTGPEIHALCSLIPVRTLFGFDDEALERIGRWIVELGVTWGLDGEHRGEWVPDTIAEGTWAATLDRLLLGAAIPAPVPRTGPDDIVPFDDMDASAFVTTGRLAEVIGRLTRLRRAADSPHIVEDWIAVLTDLVTSLLSTDADDAWQTIEVMETIADIGRSAATEGGSSTVLLGLNDIRSLLFGLLDDPHGRLNLRSGAVTVTAMVPVRNLPSRVICILGIDDSAVRSSTSDGDDLLGIRPCVGERDPRTESRHLLLDAVMAAGDHLVITCDGSDITTNRPLPLPVLITELLDIVGAVAPDRSVVVRHPRQAYDERNFGVGSNGAPTEPFSFDAAMLAAAQRRRTQPTTIHVTNADLPVLPGWLPATVQVTDLADAVARPARTYLGQRLDVRLPRPVEETETDIPLGLGGLDLWQLAGELLGHRRRGSDDTAIQTWRDAKRRGGTLPPRSLGDAVIDDVVREVEILMSARPDMADLIQATGTTDVDVPLTVTDDDGHVVTTHLRQTIGQIAGDVVVRVEFSRPKNRHAIAAALELAALVITDPERAWEAIVVLRPSSATGSKPSVDVLRPRRGPDGATAARRLLDATAEILYRALREPIPMFDKSSRSMHTDGTIGDEEFESDLRDGETGFVWGESTPDEVLALEVRADDVAGVVHASAVGSGHSRAVGFARYFWTAYDDFLGRSSDAAEDFEAAGAAS